MNYERDIILILLFTTVLGSIISVITKQKKDKCFLEPFTWWVIYLVTSIAFSLASAYLAKGPDPRTPKSGTLEDFDFPTIDQTRKVQVIFGKVRQKDPNIVWYGDLKSTAIRK